jgi:hypothetical protein
MGDASVKGEEQRTHWDQKYEQSMVSLTKPDPFFLSAYEEFVSDSYPSAGAALDLAGGIGRHALWLADKRWQVSVVDISEVAISRLSQETLQLNLALDLFALEATEYKFEPAQFDLIVLFYHFDRTLYSRIVSALKPGGYLISKSSLQWDSGEIPVPVSTDSLQRNEILSLVPELCVMYHRERPVGNRGVVEFVGKKPAVAHELPIEPDSCDGLREAPPS